MFNKIPINWIARLECWLFRSHGKYLMLTVSLIFLRSIKLTAVYYFTFVWLCLMILYSSYACIRPREIFTGLQVLTGTWLELRLFQTRHKMMEVRSLGVHIFTSHGIVILYLYTILWQKSLSNGRLWRCSWRKIVIVCQPIRTIISIWVDIQLSLSISTKKMVFFTQWEIVCDWFHMMAVEPINKKPNF